MEKINYLLPEESAEMTLNQVKSLRQIEGRLRKLFGLKNYQEVMPPSFEYTQLYTALESNGKTFNQEKMFQFINHDSRPIFFLNFSRQYLGKDANFLSYNVH